MVPETSIPIFHTLASRCAPTTPPAMTSTKAVTERLSHLGFWMLRRGSAQVLDFGFWIARRNLRTLCIPRYCRISEVALRVKSGRIVCIGFPNPKSKIENPKSRQVLLDFLNQQVFIDGLR
jgi:hypothetical protein